MCLYNLPETARWSLSQFMFPQGGPERCRSPFPAQNPSIPCWPHWSCLPISQSFSASPTLYSGSLILSNSEVLLCLLQPSPFTDRNDEPGSLLTAIATAGRLELQNTSLWERRGCQKVLWGLSIYRLLNYVGGSFFLEL